MKRRIEVELRFDILNFDHKIDLSLSSKKRIVDKYYDTKSGVLFKKGIFIRIRNDKTLDFKYNYEDLINLNIKNDHTHCDENSFALPLEINKLQSFTNICNILNLKTPTQLTVKDFIKTNQLVKLATVDKTRQHATANGFEISIDNVKDLGRFIEVEKIIEVDINDKDYDNSLKSLKQEIKAFTQSLNLDLKQNKTGYCELILRKTNFELYKQGKYLLTEDE